MTDEQVLNELKEIKDHVKKLVEIFEGVKEEAQQQQQFPQPIQPQPFPKLPQPQPPKPFLGTQQEQK